VAVGVLIAIVALISVAVWKHTHPSAYDDGRGWASLNEFEFGLPQPFPGCNRREMASSGQVRGDGVIVTGDGKPHDNYASWRAGCLSMKADYARQNANW